MAETTIFISCTKANLDVARNVAAALRIRGIKAWLYESDIPYGAPNWLEEVEKAIRSCAGVILIATPELLTSHASHEEATLAYAFNVPIYPAQADGDELSKCVWDSFQYQSVDIRDGNFERGINKLIDQIQQSENAKQQNAIVIDKQLAQDLIAKDGGFFEAVGKERPSVEGLLENDDDRKQVCAFLKNRIVRQYELIFIANPERQEELKAFGLMFLFQVPINDVARQVKTTVESVEALKKNALVFLQKDLVFVSTVRDWLDIKC